MTYEHYFPNGTNKLISVIS